MARVLALIPDLLFGSRVQADLLATGHEVGLVGTVEDARERLSGADVLIVDLTDERLHHADLVKAPGDREETVSESPRDVAGRGSRVASQRLRTLGFYSHVDTVARERAKQAGFDLVVPRSRMAREGANLVSGLLAH